MEGPSGRLDGPSGCLCSFGRRVLAHEAVGFSAVRSGADGRAVSWGPDVLAQLSSESHQISVAPDTTNNLHGEHAEVRVDVWNASSKNGLSALL